MKSSSALILTAVLYFGLAIFVAMSLFWWTEYTGKPITSLLVGLVALISAACAFLGFASLKARFGAILWVRLLAIGGGTFLGSAAAFGGWNGLLLFGTPFAMALFGIWTLRARTHAG